MKHEFKKQSERKSLLGLDKLAAVKREEQLRTELEEKKKMLKGEESEWDTTSHIRGRTTSEQSGFTPTPDRRRREEERGGRSERRSERGGSDWDRSERRWYEMSERSRDRERDRNRDYDRDRDRYSERRRDDRGSDRRDYPSSRREGYSRDSRGPETPRSVRGSAETPRSQRGSERRPAGNVEYTPASTPSWKHNEWMRKSNVERTPAGHRRFV